MRQHCCVPRAWHYHNDNLMTTSFQQNNSPCGLMQRFIGLLENLVWIGAAALLLVGVGALRTHSQTRADAVSASSQKPSVP